MRRRDAGESDRRLTILSEEEGVVEVVAKGAKKAGSRLAGSSEPLAVAVFHLAAGKRQSYVTQCQPVTTFSGLRADYDRLCFGLALTEISGQVFPVGQSDPDGFQLLLRALKYVELHPKPEVALLWAQVQLLRHAGYAPSWRACVVSGDSIREADAYFTPRGGGYVSVPHSGPYGDRMTVRAEVLYVLDALESCEQPPDHARFSQECLKVLFAVWREVLDAKLSASEQALSLILK